MKQSKLESHIEASANIASGFVISWIVWMYVVAPGVQAGLLQVGPAGDALIVTGIFTVTSYIRSYIWRRFFNAGIHRAVHRAINKTQSKFKKGQHLFYQPSIYDNTVGEFNRKPVTYIEEQKENRHAVDYKGQIIIAWTDELTE